MPVIGIDDTALSFVAKFAEKGYRELLQAGISGDHFDPDYQNVWGFINRMHKEQGTIPGTDTLQKRFPHFSPVRVNQRDLPVILRDLKLRYKWSQFLLTSSDMATRLGSGWDNIDDVLEQTVGKFTSLLNENGSYEKLLDAFSQSSFERVLLEMEERKKRGGIKSGLPKLDRVTGGFYPEQMVVLMGRTGAGKSWINLLFVANAILSGHRAVLFSLEMSFYEVALRLYTIFSAMLTPRTLLEHSQLTAYGVGETKLRRFMDFMRERFEGKLYIGDAGRHHDAYTLERIAAEVEGIRPDMFWVDYLTLLRQPNGSNKQGWEAVRDLSRGIKHTAQKVKCVGGCSAQVARSAISGDSASLIPRLEHIAFGDSIGHDADLVVSLGKPGRARTNEKLYWALVKHRNGKEIGKQTLRFNPDQGEFSELKEELEKVEA